MADTDDTQYLHKAESYFTQLAVLAADLTYTGIPRKILCITVYNFIHQGKKNQTCLHKSFPSSVLKEQSSVLKD